MVRPEEMTIAKQAELGISFVGRVEFIEKLGDTPQVFLNVGEGSISTTTEAHFEIEAGDEGYLIPYMERMHSFAGENEVNIYICSVDE